MATFNLADYETVEERIKRFYSDHPKGRIITDLIEHVADKGMWVCKSYIFMSDADIDPQATGMAFEIDGQGMATSHHNTRAAAESHGANVNEAYAEAHYTRT